MSPQVNCHYSVMWKFKDQRVCRANYDAPSFGDLLRMLRRSEGVSPESTDQFAVHQHMPNGEVHELLAHDQSAGATLFTMPKPQEIKLLPAPAAKKKELWISGGQGRFFAKEA